jgi:dipeptidyl aminopeptidase/acylaminoacyl peptidase
MLHGDADQTVPFDQSKRFLAKLHEAGVPAELIVVPGAPHGMKTWLNFMSDYRERVIAWLQKTMGPGGEK